MARTPPVSLDPPAESEQFLDPELRSFVKGIEIGTPENSDAQPQSKRRKTGLPQTLSRVTNLLWKLVGAEPQDTLASYSTALLYVDQSHVKKLPIS